ncbi:lytic murein transglycosylase [Microbacterium sp. Marseille-Q6965]|uniref:lytic murein transglycosylase n=1 Tax=Microbacterium sp. Marseille-Q6965 TaxID=2965072 RepID=UPI0021B7E43E|nr:lytic murein transglycosylase [Microbacterium sp. Marseille-Q6965]
MASKRRGAGIGTVCVVLAVVGAVAVWGVVTVVGALSGFRPAEGWEPEAAAPSAPDPLSAAPALAPVGSDGAIEPTWLTEVAGATGIPERALAAYAAADARARQDGCAVGWNTLAGIGWVESHHGALHGGEVQADGFARPEILGIPLDGTNRTLAIPDTDGGALDGDTEWDRAVGPLQFIPETWRRWGVDANGDGAASPHSIDDAAAAAADYLCRLDGTLEGSDAWIRAIRSYNDTLDYQTQVARAAVRYAASG